MFTVTISLKEIPGIYSQKCLDFSAIPNIEFNRKNLTSSNNKRRVRPPKFVHSKNGIHTVNPGEIVRLDCGLQNIWQTRITWTRPRNRTRFWDRKKHNWSHHFQYLKIHNTKKIDEGLYKCEAVNKAGRIQKLFSVNVRLV
jgi:hypothetical protein